MAQAKTLETKDLRLENHSDEFVTETYVAWLNDPEVVRYSEQRFKKHTLASCREYVDGFKSSPNFLWAVVEKSTEKHLGNICALIDGRNQVAELRILLGAKESQGKGYGRQAWQAVIDHCFRLGMRKVFAGTLVVNERMLGVMRATGMQEEARLPDHSLFEGKPTAAVFFSIYK